MLEHTGKQRITTLPECTDNEIDWLSTTPGACHCGLYLGTDDPQRFGWDKIFEVLSATGIFGFRLIPVLEMHEVALRLEEMGYRLAPRAVYSTGMDTIRAVAAPISADGPPSGVREIPVDSRSADDIIVDANDFLAKNDIVSCPAPMWRGGLGRTEAVVAATPTKPIIAAGLGYFPHNALSAHRDAALVGLVVTDRDSRKSGLGRWINARLAIGLVERHGARSVYATIEGENAVSRRMVEASGLTHDPTLMCGVATRDPSRRGR